MLGGYTCKSQQEMTGKVNFLGFMQHIEHFDIELEASFESNALDTLLEHELSCRILRICFLVSREHQDTVMLALDVKDAFLIVLQEQPTRVRCTNALPGQREGSLLWHRDLVQFISERILQMKEHEAYPSVLRSQRGDCMIMIHVDDLLIVGS
eukprot:s929_g4.t1